MQTTSFNPASISLSDAAKQHVVRQLQREEANGLMLDVRESGCNGYMYELRFVQDLPSNAHIFEFGDGVSVAVEDDHWKLVRGTHIDLVTEGLNSSLRFENPNADTHCGCGESFSIRGA